MTSVVAWAAGGRWLDEADVVGGDAVEAVGVVDLAGVGRRRSPSCPTARA